LRLLSPSIGMIPMYPPSEALHHEGERRNGFRGPLIEVTMPAHRGLNGRCTVCSALERVQIELLLAGGASQRSIARKYSLSHYAISRHWSGHVSDERKANLVMGPVQRHALAARVAEESTSVIDQLRLVRVGLFRSYDTALTAGDSLSIASIAGRLHENLRITGGITGELASSPLIQQTTINNNLYTSPEYVRLRAGLLQLTRNHPQIAPSIVALLKRLDAEPESAAELPPPRQIEHEAVSV
jgi:hypothetical protein